jgi:hypothetical protein
MSKSWYWILLALVLLALCIWLWTQWSGCEDELADCVSTPTVEPPPGPIIDIDPKADFVGGESAFTIEGSAASCITVTDNTITSAAVGLIDKFETVAGSPPSTVSLDRFEAVFEFPVGSATTQTLVIERSSSGGFNWELDGTVLTPADRGTIYELREDLCGAAIVGTPQIIWTVSGLTQTAASDETVELRTGE